MGQDALSPDGFNKRLRAWVRDMTGGSIGTAAGQVMSRSKAYRLTQGDHLLALPDLLELVRACLPADLPDPDRETWETEWRAEWHRSRRAMDGAETVPAPRQAPDLVGSPSPVHMSAPGPDPEALLLPRAKVVRLGRPGGRSHREPLADVLEEWFQDEVSNLLLVSAPSGSGTSTEIRLWLDSHPDVQGTSLLRGPIDFEAYVGPGGAPPTLVIDDFDPAATRNDGGSRPDLRLLRDLLHRRGRCVLVTKRNPMTELDELAEQLRSPARLGALGAVEPLLVRVVPISADDILDLAQKRGDARLHELATMVRQAGWVGLASPLTLHQLYRTPGRTPIEARTQWEVHNTFLRHVCGLAYDQGVSRIRGQARFDIYRELAWSIFQGVERRRAFRRLALSVEDVTAETIDGLRRARQVTTGAGLPDDTVRWTDDLLGLEEVFGLLGDNADTAYFRQSSYYEFFVAEAIGARLRDGRSLDLNEAVFAEAAMDSLILGFLRARMTEDGFEALIDLCQDRSTPWLDRMICLYLLEDRPGFKAAIDQAPAAYWRELERAQEMFTSFILRKAMMYQMIVADRASAWDYVELVQSAETPEGQALERAVLGSTAEITASLLVRLHSPDLAPALPITVLRLGQMGDATCLQALEALEGDERMREWVAAAVRHIRARRAPS